MFSERDELHELINNLPNNINFKKFKIDLQKLILDSEIESEEIDVDTLKRIKKAEKEIENGEYHTIEEVFGDLLNEI